MGRMKLTVPQVRIGKPSKGDGFVVFPLLQDSAEKHIGYRLSGDGVQDHTLSFIEMGEIVGVGNVSNERVLILPGDQVGRSTCFTTSILVPPKTHLELPAICVGRQPHLVIPGPWYRREAVGLIVYAGTYWVSLFDKPSTCERVWQRSVGVMGETWINKVRRTKKGAAQAWSAMCAAKWKAVESVGLGQEWVCNEPGVGGTALTYRRSLLHLEAVVDLDRVRPRTGVDRSYEQSPKHQPREIEKQLWLPFPE